MSDKYVDYDKNKLDSILFELKRMNKFLKNQTLKNKNFIEKYLKEKEVDEIK